MRGAWAMAIMGLLVAAGLPARAQQAAAHPCAAMADPRARLACYDRAFPPQVSEEERARQVARGFGLEGRAAAAASGQPEALRMPARLEATVVEVRGEPGEGRVIVLDNGQRWRQVEASPLGRLQPGDRVVLKDAAFSSYLMVTPARVALRVKRVQ